jgi:hypothetical protein
MILFENREILKGENRKQKEQRESNVFSSFGIKLFRRLEQNLSVKRI